MPQPERFENFNDNQAVDGQNEGLNLLGLAGPNGLSTIRQISAMDGSCETPTPPRGSHENPTMAGGAGEDSSRSDSDSDEKPENIPQQENRNETITQFRPPQPTTLPDIALYEPPADMPEEDRARLLGLRDAVAPLIRELREARQAQLDLEYEEARRAWETAPPVYEPSPVRDPNANPWDRRRARTVQ